MNGTIEFHRIGGVWKGKTWNGDEWIHWKRPCLTKGEAERYAASMNHKAKFIEP